MPVDNVAPNSPATSAWANDVADTINSIETAPASNIATLAPGSSAVGDSIAAGSSSRVSRADHRHGRESFGAAPPVVNYGGGSAPGTAATPARSDHTHGLSTKSLADFLALPIIAPSISTDQHNWAPTGHATASVIRVTNSSSTSRAITGLAGGVTGRVVYLIYDPGSVGDIVLGHEDAGSSSANRFQIPAGSARVLRGFMLIYMNSRWWVVG